MKQADLDREVARSTGETVDRISRHGFSLVVMPAPQRAQEPYSPARKKEPRPQRAGIAQHR